MKHPQARLPDLAALFDVPLDLISARLSCGSLRLHRPHGWVGQSSGGLFRCTGVAR